MHYEIEQQGGLCPRPGHGLYVEGFARLRVCAHKAFSVQPFRNAERVEHGWEYPDVDGSQVVGWETGRAPPAGRHRRVTFVWTCALGGGQGSYTHALSLQGLPAVRITTPIGRQRVWRGTDGIRIDFDVLSRTPNGEAHGVMYLTVPAHRLTPGKPARLDVRGMATPLRNYSFFMLAGYTDTLRRARRLYGEGFDVVRSGRAACAGIALPPDPGPVERFAARELQQYIRRMSGATLRIRRGLPGAARGALVVATREGIRDLLGPRAPVCRAYARRDGIRVVAWKGNLVLTGSNARSVLFAVYQWLTCRGCRWFEPGPAGEVMPRRPVLRVQAVDWKHAPSYTVRAARPTEDSYVYTPADAREHIDWMAKNGMNGCKFLFPPYHRLRRTLTAETRKRGLILNVGSHNFYQWLPPSLFARHPEYFALHQGRRVPEAACGCASNPAGLEQWARNAVAWARAHPDVDEITIGANDGARYCQCPACRNLRPAEQLQVFFDQAARAIRRAFPGKRLHMSAYTGRYWPMRDTRRTIPGTQVTVDLFARCQRHPLLTARCDSPNRQYQDLSQTPEARAPEINRFLCHVVAAWVKTLDEVGVFENVMLHARADTPYPYARVLAQDIRYLHDVGVRSFAAQADRNRWAQGAGNMLVVARLLWDTNLGPETIIGDYYRRAFGPAGESLRAGEQILEHACERAHAVSLLEALTPEDADACRRFLRAARRQARKTEHLAALRRTALLFEFTFRLWELQRLRADVLAALAAGNGAAARIRRAAAVRKGRAFLAFAGRHGQKNIFYANTKRIGVTADACMNGYPFVRRPVSLPAWARPALARTANAVEYFRAHTGTLLALRARARRRPPQQEK